MNTTYQQTSGSQSIFYMLWESISRIIGTCASMYFGFRFLELALQHELFKTDASYSFAAFGSTLFLYSLRIMFMNMNNSFTINYSNPINENKEISNNQ